MKKSCDAPGTKPSSFIPSCFILVCESCAARLTQQGKGPPVAAPFHPQDSRQDAIVL
jgi:hypothetical protein